MGVLNFPFSFALSCLRRHLFALLAFQRLGSYEIFVRGVALINEFGFLSSLVYAWEVGDPDPSGRGHFVMIVLKNCPHL